MNREWAAVAAMSIIGLMNLFGFAYKGHHAAHGIITVLCLLVAGMYLGRIIDHRDHS